MVRDGAFVIEHGWLEKDGVIVAPTLIDGDLTYFPGLRFTGQQGLSEAMLIPKPEITWEDRADSLPEIRCLKMPLNEAVHKIMASEITHGPSCVLILKTALRLG